MSEEVIDEAVEAQGMFEQQLAKVDSLTAEGVLPFGERFDGAEAIETIRARFVEDCEDEQPATIAGRLISFRDMGVTVQLVSRFLLGKRCLKLMTSNVSKHLTLETLLVFLVLCF